MLSSFLEEVKLLRDGHCDKILRLDLKVFSILVYILFSSAILFIEPLLLITTLDKHVFHHGIASSCPLVGTCVL